MSNKAWEKVYADLSQWTGYCEKDTDDERYIEDKTANAGYNEYNRFAKWMDDNCPGFLNKVANKSWIGWCTVIPPYSICKAFGTEAAAKFFHVTPGKNNLLLSVGMTANYFKSAKEYYPRSNTFKPQAGDLIFIDSQSKDQFAHIGWVVGIDPNGKVRTWEGNTGRTSGLPYCGGCTAEKTYWTYDTRITGYARPNWDYLNSLMGDEDEAPIIPAPEPAPAPTPEEENPPILVYNRNLKKGSTGEDVEALQEALNRVGNYGLVVDGEFGNATDKAVRDYQKKKGLKVDGIYGKDTYNALLADLEALEAPEEDKEEEGAAIDLSSIKRTLFYGCQGEDVKLIQLALKELGYDGTKDGEGIFALETMRAVCEFQIGLAVPIDGIVDEDILMEIIKAIE